MEGESGGVEGGIKRSESGRERLEEESEGVEGGIKKRESGGESEGREWRGRRRN